MKSKKKKSWRY